MSGFYGTVLTIIGVTGFTMYSYMSDVLCYYTQNGMFGKPDFRPCFSYVISVQKNGSASQWHTLHFSVDNHLKNHCKKALMSHNFHKCVRCYSSSRNDSVRRWARCALPRLRTIRRVGSVRQSSADAATAGDSERCCCRLGRSRSISKFSALRAFHPMWPFTCHICARVLLWLLQLQQPKLCSDGRFLPSLSIVAA